MAGDVRILYLVTCRHCGERMTVGDADIAAVFTDAGAAEAGKRILREQPTQRCPQCGVEGAYGEGDLIVGRLYTWE
ncbi:MAG TPA: hypothetical protein VKZ50_05910 [bacterium]|nr:hypothetical protein [bacterium]